ncbi:MAG: CDP-diacylglycerol--serine O-phosphatidyltransferase [Muribaculaceae bacterium]|nr:CDP-diacylglycerol--serine O-phosphatidyltransferase [Muribaculaceae bacterium]
MNVIKRNIPNLITCINVLSGCVAIILTFTADDPVQAVPAWIWASLAIGVAAVADFLDGFSARLLKAWSDVGKELDSLSDLVSFGVAPAMILFSILSEDPGLPAWLRWCALIIPALGALRLARFNVDSRQTTSFIGLPIPANALFWIGFAAVFTSFPEWRWLHSVWFILPLIIVEAWLMVSPLPLFSLKFHSYGWKGNENRWILIAGAVVLLFFFGLQGLVPVILLYLLLSAISLLSAKESK